MQRVGIPLFATCAKHNEVTRLSTPPKISKKTNTERIANSMVLTVGGCERLRAVANAKAILGEHSTPKEHIIQEKWMWIRMD